MCLISVLLGFMFVVIWDVFSGLCFGLYFALLVVCIFVIVGGFGFFCVCPDCFGCWYACFRANHRCFWFTSKKSLC